MKVLCLDGGSSTLKYAVFDVEANAERALLRGQESPDAALDRITHAIESSKADSPDAVGHRIVFGGPDRFQPALVTDALFHDLRSARVVDPLHIDPELKLLSAARAKYPNVPHVACFDTAFHRGMPDVAKRLPLPSGGDPLLQRYGYHGLSYEYIVAVLRAESALTGRILIAHLGSGASLSAVRNGKPIDTTMGMTPLGGLMMGTRPGDLDPGILLYLLAGGYSSERLAELLYRRAGLLGVSGTTASMEAIVRASASDDRAREALALFVYQACKHAGAMIAALGGLDLFVFTGGIGENSSEVRKRICAGLAFAGISIDAGENERNADLISAKGSAARVRIIKTDENRMIARHAYELLTSEAATQA